MGYPILISKPIMSTLSPRVMMSHVDRIPLGCGCANNTTMKLSIVLHAGYKNLCTDILTVSQVSVVSYQTVPQ